MRDVVMRVSNVSKRFRIGPAHDSLRDLVAGGISRLLRRRKQPVEHGTFEALHDVSFAVSEGEAFGIIGPNGAGKSTILRLAAGILRPDSGRVTVKGRLTALIEVGAGFHGDLTGRENIFLNGAILGMTRAEVRRKLDPIVSFAGVGRFLDMPVKRYSSGMHARLGFSIAAHVDPKVLLVDEVLSVGDAVFRLRCLERMRELMNHGTALVFVTHNLDQMRAICHRAMVLEKGISVYDGPSAEAVDHYLAAVSRAHPVRPTDLTETDVGVDGSVELIRFKLLNEAGEETISVRANEAVRAELTFRLRRPIPRLVVELNMRALADVNVISLNSGRDGVPLEGKPGVSTLTLMLRRIPVAGGQYFWNVRMWDVQTGETLLDTPLKFPMVIDDEGRGAGLVTVDREWTFDPAPACHSSANSVLPSEADPERSEGSGILRAPSVDPAECQLDENLLLR